MSGLPTSRELIIGISTPLLRVSFFTPSRCCHSPYFALLTNSTSANFVELPALSRSVCYLLLFILTGLSRCENVSWASFHLPFSLI